MKKIQRVLNIIHISAVFLSIFFMAALVIIIFIHVILRYVFNSGLQWGQEVASNVLTPAFVFLGMAIGVEEDLHINIDIIPKNIPKGFENFMLKLKHICNLFMGGIFVYFGIILINFTSTSVLSASQLPAFLQYIVMPLSGALIIFITLLYLFNIARNERLISRIIGTFEIGEEE
jgi:TRAP-type transport system small permease protein